MPYPHFNLPFALLFLASSGCSGGHKGGDKGGDKAPDPPGDSGDDGIHSVAISRDASGTPHVRSETDLGAFYGMGWVQAADRLLSMNIHVWAAQGRMSEALGSTWLEDDTQARLLGTWRHAQEVQGALPEEHQALLQAYADGVNAWLDTHPADRNPLFETLGMEPEAWTPAHSLAAWTRLGSFFGSVKLNKVENYYEFNELVDSEGMEAAIAAYTNTNPGDPDAAVVQVEDVPQEVQQAIADYAASMGYGDSADSSRSDGAGGPNHSAHHPTNFGHESPKFSHAWAISGAKTSTGAPVLISDPQVPMIFPNLFHELQLTGESFNVRGISSAGAATFLIAFNEHIAWGLTAAGADIVDLFRLEMTGTDSYRVDGEELTMESHEETILVKDADPVTVTHRSSIWGPVVTDLVEVAAGDGFAAKGAPYTETDHNTFIGAVEMMRASNLDALRAATDEWRHPSANFVAAEKGGDIFYTILGAIPVRSTLSPLGGMIAQEGNSLAHDHQDTIPNMYKPWVKNPAAGYIFSGNHRVEDGWYPLPLGLGSGGGGHTTRSRRLGELLAALPAAATTSQIIEGSQMDCANSSKRDMVRLLAEAISTDQRANLSADAGSALTALYPWALAGGDMRTGTEGTFLASHMSTMFRNHNNHPALDDAYGGGDNGLTFFLSTQIAALEADPRHTLDDDAFGYLSTALEDAWRDAIAQEADSAKWTAAYAASSAVNKSLGWFESNFALGSSFDGGEVHDSPQLLCGDGQTILSQGSQVYTHVVDFSDIDNSQSILAIGSTEGVSDAWWDAQSTLWAEGSLKPAPLTAAAIDALVTLEVELTYEP